MPNQGKGSRPRLNRTVLVASAVTIADTEGLEAVTVRRLAQLHEVAPTALYWHFKDKDALLNGMAEQLFGEVRLPLRRAPGSWPEELRALLEAFVAVLRPHPFVAPLLSERALDSDAGLTVTERALLLLSKAGLAPDRAAETGSYLLSAVVALVAAEPGRHLPKDEEEREDAVRVKRASIIALSPRRFPTVVTFADPLSNCASPDDYYAFGIDMLISGVTQMAEPRA